MDELTHLHPDQVFLRREALGLGYSDLDLRNAVRDGFLARVRHGAYTSHDLWSAADERERHRLRGRAAQRTHRTAVLLSHTTAAIEHRLRLFEPVLDRVHLTCVDAVLSRTTRDIAYHHASCDTGPLADEQIAVPLARAAVESASLGDVRQGMVVLDSALESGLSPDDLLAAYAARERWPKSRVLQISLRLARPGSNSVGESLMRYVMWRTHLPEPVLQYEVFDSRGRFVGRTDFAWPEYGVLGEFDGMIKYADLRRPGETPAEALYREKVREDRLREATGWPMIRFVWADIFAPERTAERIRKQLDRGSLLKRR